MPTNSSFIQQTVNDVQAILDHVEAAQAIAAARAQEWQARTAGGMVLAAEDFTGYEERFTAAQFADVATALNAAATILGGYAVVYYRIKE